MGFPNVGKSTLFNRLAGRRDAVVNAEPGVTRDRRQAGAEWNGRAFQLLDTGGIDEADPSDVGRQVAAQALRGIEEADLVLFVVNVATAPTAGDLEIADRLRRSGRPLMLVANKSDGAPQEAAAENLRSLGLGDPHPVSAQHGRGVGDLLDADRGAPAGGAPGRRRRRAAAGDLHHRSAERRQELDPERPAGRGARPRARPAGHHARPGRTPRSRSTGARSS